MYRVEGYISAHFAERTGFSEEDLNELWDALVNMFDHDRSASRGKMSPQQLIVFKHKDKLGNAPAHKLFDLVEVNRVGDESAPARSFSDYEVLLKENPFDGVEVKTLLS